MAEFIIIFREVLEAALIVGILYTYLNKVDQQSSIAKMWQGVLAAIVLSVVGSFLFQVLAGGFEGQAEKLFEGVVMITASVVLGSMIVWMAKNKNIADDLKSQAHDALSTKNAGWAIFSLAFIAVFREGIEIILFMYSLAAKQGAVSFISSLLGAVLALGVGYAIFVQGKKVPLKTFFNVSSVILILVAAGMMAYGVHELESAGVIPDYGRVWDINPPKLADGSYPLFHDKGYIGGLFKGLFGYNGDPSLIELGSWIMTITILGFLWSKADNSNN
ncbi:MAG: FTR1 family protein [Candidatus Neomarinimicrobiota bacterium]|nr:FTR1 family protein [Candidatus Neomarinimicrobiota bacterium]MEC9436801.1 FTR1 family protein [Candidatus Neomarinimicrobiota bacterium]MEC9474989.1 FTR1 family protein [Candidatus Neomarinimicrobiota bacterium]MED5248581.1 FTR1 family protein [Candidatus Neomarinimicrobiota bacterium]MED5434249.1 FTR1 family protein [Candidatus Neomarinimicrobiota bacterium]